MFLQAGYGAASSSLHYEKKIKHICREKQRREKESLASAVSGTQNISVLELSFTYLDIVIMISSFYSKELELDFCYLHIKSLT